MVDYIKYAIDMISIPVTINIDISKEFATPNFDISLLKIHNGYSTEINGNIITNRKQYAKYNYHESGLNGCATEIDFGFLII